MIENRQKKKFTLEFSNIKLYFMMLMSILVQITKPNLITKQGLSLEPDPKLSQAQKDASNLQQPAGLSYNKEKNPDKKVYV